VKNSRKILIFEMLLFLGAGLLLTGCKSAPELTQAQAQALIQANYDQAPAAGVRIRVNDLGMRQGVVAGYWKRTKLYPNKFWADFTLTDEGKQAVRLPQEGDVMQWRPLYPEDKRFSIIVVTAVANHLKARDVKDPQDETLPGVAKAKSVRYTEVANLDGVPDPLRKIARNPGNRLIVKRQADFVYTNGAWLLRSIE
jgi:hypothetical protein